MEASARQSDTTCVCLLMLGANCLLGLFFFAWRCDVMYIYNHNRSWEQCQLAFLSLMTIIIILRTAIQHQRAPVCLTHSALTRGGPRKSLYGLNVCLPRRERKKPRRGIPAPPILTFAMSTVVLIMNYKVVRAVQWNLRVEADQLGVVGPHVCHPST